MIDCVDSREDFLEFRDRHDVSSFLKGLIRYLKSSYYIQSKLSKVWRSDDNP